MDRANGYGNITYELCSFFSKSDDIEFVLFLPQDHERIEIEGITIKYELPSYIFRFRNFKFIPYFFRDIDLSSFDIVHSLFAFPYSFMAERLARKYSKPLMMGAQGTFGVRPLTIWPEKIFLNKSYRNAKKIIVPSEFTKNKINEISGENYNIDVIHNGVDYERFLDSSGSTEVKEKYGGKKIITTVGGLKPRKGQDIVLKAMPKILEEHPNTVYMVVGGGEWLGTLEALAKELGIEGDVDFVGQINADEVNKYFHACDLYVHTPRVTHLNFEGFGIVYIEASACEKPIVATDAGGIKDAIVEGKTGFVVGDEDVDAVAEAVIKILNDEELSKRLGKDGKEYAKQHDWSIIGQKYLDAYSEVQQ